MPERFVVCHTGDPPPDRVRDRLADHGIALVPLDLRATEASVLLSELRPTALLITDSQRGRPCLSAELIHAAGSLRLVTCVGQTRDAEDYEGSVDLDALRARGIALTTTTGMEISVAEGTLALLTALNLDLVPVNAAAKAADQPATRTRRSLYGSSLGIVGMGRVGRRVARLAFGLGMRVLYFSRRRHLDVEDELGAVFLELDALFTGADTVSIHTTPSLTRGLIERSVLAHARGIDLVNTADPEIVDADALTEALWRGWVRRAAIEGEYPPPLQERFRRFGNDRVLLLPSMSSNTVHARERAWEAYVDTLLSFKEKKRIPYRIC